MGLYCRISAISCVLGVKYQPKDKENAICGMVIVKFSSDLMYYCNFDTDDGQVACRTKTTKSHEVNLQRNYGGNGIGGNIDGDTGHVVGA